LTACSVWFAAAFTSSSQDGSRSAMTRAAGGLASASTRSTPSSSSARTASRSRGSSLAGWVADLLARRGPAVGASGDPALVGAAEADDHSQETGLSGTVGPEQRGDAPGLGRRRDFVHRGDSAVALHRAIDFDHARPDLPVVERATWCARGGLQVAIV
jgi:hypothetical protein